MRICHEGVVVAKLSLSSFSGAMIGRCCSAVVVMRRSISFGWGWRIEAWCFQLGDSQLYVLNAHLLLKAVNALLQAAVALVQLNIALVQLNIALILNAYGLLYSRTVFLLFLAADTDLFDCNLSSHFAVSHGCA